MTIRDLVQWRSVLLLRRMLTDRLRSRAHPERGRITSRNVAAILKASRVEAAKLARDVPREPSPGGRLMVRRGIEGLALYRAMLGAGIEKQVAIELCSDVMYAAYRRQVRLVRFLGRTLSRAPLRQMELMQRMFLWFPLRGGYQPEIVQVAGASAYDLHRCPVLELHERMGDEALELFRASWCSFDSQLAAHLVEGGWYERPLTLSAGDPVCAMRWFAPDSPRGAVAGRTT